MKQNTKNTSISATAVRRSGWLPLVACAAMLAGCTADDTLPANGSSDTPVVFTTSLQSVALPAAQSATPHTRTDIGADGETVWTQGDAVGVFMLTAGGTIPDDIISEVNNIKYNAAPSGTLTPANTPVYYPRTGKVDFIAFYPYSDKGTGNGKITADYKYGISVADQSHPENIDVLYAKAENKERTQSPVDLRFKHVLSKIMLNIKLGDGLTGLTADKITAVILTGMPATATLSLQDGTLAPGTTANISAVKTTTPSPGATATFTALVPPQAAGSYTRNVIVMVNGEEYTGTIPGADAYVSNEMYIYPVTVQKTGISIGKLTIAPWEENDRGSGTTKFAHTVTFDANGGSGIIPAPIDVVINTSIILPEGKQITPPVSKYFAGWNTAADYSGKFNYARDTFTPQRNTTFYAQWVDIIAKFRSYFYERDGRVRANKKSSFKEKEWAVAVNERTRPCNVFTDITGMFAPLTTNYDYTYSSADGKCIVRIVGTYQFDKEYIYANLYVKIEDCPDIDVIHICSLEYYFRDIPESPVIL